eukprot:SM000190S04861  [mRNA]  locus=s190:88814:90681:+ [translate_table: standard]
MRWFLRLYSQLVEGSEGSMREVAGSSVLQGGSASSATAGLLPAPDSAMSLPDSFRPPLRQPLPYDTESRYLRVRDGLVLRREKAGTNSYHGDIEALRRTSEMGEAMAVMQRRAASDPEDSASSTAAASGPLRPDSPLLKQQASSAPSAIPRNESLMSLSADEDFCPTCLEGYTNEDPKIMTACGHHFHLGCIYEWMERSHKCPVCDKEMIFSESL